MYYRVVFSYDIYIKIRTITLQPFGQRSIGIRHQYKYCHILTHRTLLKLIKNHINNIINITYNNLNNLKIKFLFNKQKQSKFSSYVK